MNEFVKCLMKFAVAVCGVLAIVLLTLGGMLLFAPKLLLSYPKDNEIVVCKGTAEKLGINVDDKIIVTNDDFDRIELTVAGVMDNYIGNYLFITPNTMEQFCGDISVKAAYINFKQNTDINKSAATLLGDETVSHITLSRDIRETIESSFESLNLVVVLIIFCAGVLAFIVLFNLININIGERIREIATIKVLGFYANESSAYVFREVNMLTVIGGLVGLILGKFLHAFVMEQIKPDGKRLSRNIYAKTEQECEDKLKVLIEEVKAEIKAEKALLEAQENGMTISM